MANQDKALEYLTKGLGIASALLLAGLVLRFIFAIARRTSLARWAVVGPLGAVAIYIAVLMLSALPAEAAFLWLTFAFVPMTVLVTLRWLVTTVLGGRV